MLTGVPYVLIKKSNIVVFAFGVMQSLDKKFK